MQSVKVCDVTESTETKRTNTMMSGPKHDLLGRVADRSGADAMPTKRPRPNHARSVTQQVQKHSPADFPKSADAMCTVKNEGSIKREDTMARHPNYESLTIAAPAVAARKMDLNASMFSSKNEPTPSYSSTNTSNGDQVLMADSTARKVAMQSSYSLTHPHSFS